MCVVSIFLLKGTGTGTVFVDPDHELQMKQPDTSTKTSKSLKGWVRISVKWCRDVTDKDPDPHRSALWEDSWIWIHKEDSCQDRIHETKIFKNYLLIWFIFYFVFGWLIACIVACSVWGRIESLLCFQGHGPGTREHGQQRRGQQVQHRRRGHQVRYS